MVGCCYACTFQCVVHMLQDTPKPVAPLSYADNLGWSLKIRMLIRCPHIDPGLVTALRLQEIGRKHGVGN